MRGNSVKFKMINKIKSETRGRGGRGRSHSARDNALRATARYIEWCKASGYNDKKILSDPRASVKAWAESLGNSYAVSTIHTMVAGVCWGLGIDMTGIAPHGTALDKTKSQGSALRSSQAVQRECNARIVSFARMVGGRRAAYTRLTGQDFVQDESGQWCVRFVRDKGGKSQLQRIAPEHVDAVRSFFDGSTKRIFPNIDINLDLHGIRAEHARNEYNRYAKICSTPEGRQQMRQQLMSRFTDIKYGNKAYILAIEQKNYAAAARIRYRFEQECKDGLYILSGANRRAAILHDRPYEYDRLALCCVSVFALSHWRNSVTVKHYMI